jgi:hypothetical protein
MYVLHRNVAWTCSFDKQHGHAVGTFRMGMQYGHATRTCSKDMQHEHAARGAARAFRTTTGSMDMKHGYETRA